jgi:hypothetical protein
MVERADFVRSDFEASGEWSEVSAIADRLVLHLNEPETSSLIALANPPGQSSAQVQAVLLREATALGFTDERKGLFAAYDSALRPDYHLSVGGTGVILEVERGKTTINNMDLLDLWKCHICDHADYLFLMVPLELRAEPEYEGGSSQRCAGASPRSSCLATTPTSEVSCSLGTEQTPCDGAVQSIRDRFASTGVAEPAQASR